MCVRVRVCVQIDYRMLKYSPSMLVAAAVVCANKVATHEHTHTKIERGVKSGSK